VDLIHQRDHGAKGIGIGRHGGAQRRPEIGGDVAAIEDLVEGVELGKEFDADLGLVAGHQIVQFMPPHGLQRGHQPGRIGLVQMRNMGADHALGGIGDALHAPNEPLAEIETELLLAADKLIEQQLETENRRSCLAKLDRLVGCAEGVKGVESGERRIKRGRELSRRLALGTHSEFARGQAQRFDRSPEIAAAGGKGRARLRIDGGRPGLTVHCQIAERTDRKTDQQGQGERRDAWPDRPSPEAREEGHVI
jgi:hypothetical protein